MIFLIFVFLLDAFCSVSAKGENKTAVIGDEVILPCSVEEFMPLEVMEWSRAGTHPEYVLIFKNQSSDVDIPVQRYEGRVELMDKKKGNMSLVLKNVTAEDGGTYKCYVMRETGRRKRANLEAVNTVYLNVHPRPPPENKHTQREEGENRDGGNKDEEETLGNSRGHVASIVAAFVAMAVIVSVMVDAAIRWKKIKNYRHSPQDEKETPQIA
ncbi:V-set domain-containing T-cell activation inhibitor 1-like [Cyprinodon tularosa]|uniref:V-set domain-containing T-cell activation inhibitor 1-like n=1 Tax=Cyprinodon tularosa TaxID=77115 RepID=UPI0018E27D27|nr:V-set domain-containing T-cell activation inhibitor 1-like [Cyprinodon tularosa]